MSPAAAPLAGVRVVVTRAAHQAGELAAGFAAAGARVELLPLLEVVPAADPAPLARAAAAIERFDWVAFTSANAVEALLAATGGGLPETARVAAVGTATARALRRHGVEPAITGSRDAHRLAAALAPRTAGCRVLLPRAADARPTLARALAAGGAEVTAVTAYAKRLPAAAPRRAAALFGGGEPLGWVTFTSPSVVRAFADLFAAEWPRRRGGLSAAAVGPVTAAALRRAGVAPAAVAERPGAAALVAAVVAAEAANPPRGRRPSERSVT